MAKKQKWDWPDERMKYCIMVITDEDGWWTWSATIGACKVKSTWQYKTAQGATTSARRWFKKWTDFKIGKSMFFYSPSSEEREAQPCAAATATN